MSMTSAPPAMTPDELNAEAVDRAVDLHYGSGCWCKRVHGEAEAELASPPWARDEKTGAAK